MATPDTRRPGRPAAKRPTSVGGALRCPAGLSEDAQAAFAILASRLEREGIATESHTELVALAARRMAEIEMHGRAVEADGVTFITTSSTGGEMIRANPAVSMMSEATRHLHSILVDLGLTPLSVAKASKPAKAPKENPFLKHAKR